MVRAASREAGGWVGRSAVGKRPIVGVDIVAGAMPSLKGVVRSQDSDVGVLKVDGAREGGRLTSRAARRPTALAISEWSLDVGCASAVRLTHEQRRETSPPPLSIPSTSTRRTQHR